jgi:hypothetical protein
MVSRNIRVRVSLIIAAGVLFAGVAAVIGQRETPAGVSIDPFTELLPRANELPGWSASQRPVADTEEMKRAVAELLNYDGGGFVTYTNGDLQISIYAAYWKLGKMSPRLVATHTPDGCWIGNGWVCQSAGIADLKVSNQQRLRVKTRVFAAPVGVPQHMMFCHVVGGLPRDYGQFGAPAWYAFLSELRWGGLNLREEQLFFRISSNHPLETFSDAAPVRLFLSRLGPFLRTTQPSE